MELCIFSNILWENRWTNNGAPCWSTGSIEVASYSDHVIGKSIALSLHEDPVKGPMVEWGKESDEYAIEVFSSHGTVFFPF